MEVQNEDFDSEPAAKKVKLDEELLGAVETVSKESVENTNNISTVGQPEHVIQPEEIVHLNEKSASSVNSILCKDAKPKKKKSLDTSNFKIPKQSTRSTSSSSRKTKIGSSKVCKRINKLKSSELLSYLKTNKVTTDDTNLCPVDYRKLSVRLVMSVINVGIYSNSDIFNWITNSSKTKYTTFNGKFTKQFEAYKLLYNLLYATVDTDNGEKLLDYISEKSYATPHKMLSWFMIFRKMPTLLETVSMNDSVSEQTKCLKKASWNNSDIRKDETKLKKSLRSRNDSSKLTNYNENVKSSNLDGFENYMFLSFIDNIENLLGFHGLYEKVNTRIEKIEHYLSKVVKMKHSAGRQQILNHHDREETKFSNQMSKFRSKILLINKKLEAQRNCKSKASMEEVAKTRKTEIELLTTKVNSLININAHLMNQIYHQNLYSNVVNYKLVALEKFYSPQKVMGSCATSLEKSGMSNLNLNGLNCGENSDNVQNNSLFSPNGMQNQMRLPGKEHIAQPLITDDFPDAVLGSEDHIIVKIPKVFSRSSLCQVEAHYIVNVLKDISTLNISSSSFEECKTFCEIVDKLIVLEFVMELNSSEQDSRLLNSQTSLVANLKMEDRNSCLIKKFRDIFDPQYNCDCNQQLLKVKHLNKNQIMEPFEEILNYLLVNPIVPLGSVIIDRLKSLVKIIDPKSTSECCVQTEDLHSDCSVQTEDNKFTSDLGVQTDDLQCMNFSSCREDILVPDSDVQILDIAVLKDNLSGASNSIVNLEFLQDCTVNKNATDMDHNFEGIPNSFMLQVRDSFSMNDFSVRDPKSTSNFVNQTNPLMNGEFLTAKDYSSTSDFGVQTCELDYQKVIPIAKSTSDFGMQTDHLVNVEDNSVEILKCTSDFAVQTIESRNLNFTSGGISKFVPDIDIQAGHCSKNLLIQIENVACATIKDLSTTITDLENKSVAFKMEQENMMKLVAKLEQRLEIASQRIHVKDLIINHYEKSINSQIKSADDGLNNVKSLQMQLYEKNDAANKKILALETKLEFYKNECQNKSDEIEAVNYKLTQNIISNFLGKPIFRTESYEDRFPSSDTDSNWLLDYNEISKLSKLMAEEKNTSFQLRSELKNSKEKCAQKNKEMSELLKMWDADKEKLYKFKADLYTNGKFYEQELKRLKEISEKEKETNKCLRNELAENKIVWKENIIEEITNSLALAYDNKTTCKAEQDIRASYDRQLDEEKEKSRGLEIELGRLNEMSTSSTLQINQTLDLLEKEKEKYKCFQQETERSGKVLEVKIKEVNNALKVEKEDSACKTKKIDQLIQFINIEKQLSNSYKKKLDEYYQDYRTINAESKRITDLLQEEKANSVKLTDQLKEALDNNLQLAEVWNYVDAEKLEKPQANVPQSTIHESDMKYLEHITGWKPTE